MKLVYCSKVYLYAMNAAYLPSVTHNTIVRISAYILNPNLIVEQYEIVWFVFDIVLYSNTLSNLTWPNRVNITVIMVFKKVFL